MRRIEKIDWYSPIFVDGKVTDKNGRVWKTHRETNFTAAVEIICCEIYRTDAHKRGDYTFDVIEPQSGRVVMTIDVTEHAANVRHIVRQYRQLIKEAANEARYALGPNRSNVTMEEIAERREYTILFAVFDAIQMFFASQKGKGKDMESSRR